MNKKMKSLERMNNQILKWELSAEAKAKFTDFLLSAMNEVSQPEEDEYQEWKEGGK